jgi:hypothetical protein
MEMGVSQFAHQKNVSRDRVLKLIKSGDLKAKRIGSQWVIDENQLNWVPKTSRPLSPKMQQQFLNLLSGDQLDKNKLDSSEFSRLLKKFKFVKEHEDPSLILRSWLKGRAELLEFNINNADFSKLRNSEDLVPAGASNSQSELSEGSRFEAYVEANNLKDLKKRFLLVESANPNVFLRVVKKVPNPLPLGYVLADLSDSYGPRERAKVKEILGRF